MCMKRSQNVRGILMHTELACSLMSFQARTSVCSSVPLLSLWYMQELWTVIKGTIQEEVLPAAHEALYAASACCLILQNRSAAHCSSILDLLMSGLQISRHARLRLHGITDWVLHRAIYIAEWIANGEYFVRSKKLFS